jgi:hypothetical protein
MLRVLAVSLALLLATSAIAADALQELRSFFTIGGKPVPPNVFGDFGDAMMSDGRSIVVTVDVLAAMDSNRYADPIKTNGPWFLQEKPQNRGINGPETIWYKFIGATQNGLLIVVAAWSGGGIGVFHWLHIVDAAWADAFDDDGASYRRLNLTNLRSYSLGDRWDGTVTISGNTVRVETASKRGGERPALVTLQAKRP